MKEKRGFFSHMLGRKYDWHDFVEPLTALPFAYALLRLLEGQFNIVTFVLIFVLVLIYWPTVAVFIESKRLT